MTFKWLKVKVVITKVLIQTGRLGHLSAAFVPVVRDLLKRMWDLQWQVSHAWPC